MGLFSTEKPKRITIRTGEPLACLVCQFDRFFERKGQLNSALASFLNLDWANATAECWVCGRCGHIHWFLGE